MPPVSQVNWPKTSLSCVGQLKLYRGSISCKNNQFTLFNNTTLRHDGAPKIDGEHSFKKYTIAYRVKPMKGEIEIIRIFNRNKPN